MVGRHLTPRPPVLGKPSRKRTAEYGSAMLAVTAQGTCPPSLPPAGASQKNETSARGGNTRQDGLPSKLGKEGRGAKRRHAGRLKHKKLS